MNKNLNRRKFIKFGKKNVFFSLLIIIFFSFFLFIYNNNVLINSFLNKHIQKFSVYFDYQFKSIEISGLHKTKYNQIENLLSNYYGTSIFLLPLDEISSKIKENIWIKNIKISINYKNNVIIDIIEYSPIGIFNFNNKLFYFDSTGNIIDEYFSNNLENKEFIIFSGKSSNKRANDILKVIDSFDNKLVNNILNLELIEQRRWNILLKNNIIIQLSEENPYESLKNYKKILKNLSKAQINNIINIDLRNLSKSILKYKND